ncbi:MAG: chemotaxis protein CheW [Gammaproteobacteria bacterium]
MLIPFRKSPMALLQDIDRRSRQHAVGLPLQAEAKKTWSGVAFRLAESHLVAPLLEMREILTYPGLSAVPGAKSWLKGIANVRGNLLPIIHLQSYLGSQSTPIGRRSRVLVVRHEGVVAGLVVDEVFGMKHFVEEEFTTELASNDGSKEYLEGGYIQNGQHWEVFSMQRLAQSPLFLQVAI